MVTPLLALLRRPASSELWAGRGIPRYAVLWLVIGQVAWLLFLWFGLSALGHSWLIDHGRFSLVPAMCLYYLPAIVFTERLSPSTDEDDQPGEGS